MFEVFKSSIRIPEQMGACYANLLWFSVILEIFPTYLTMHCLKCLFHMDNKVCAVPCVERTSIWNGTSGNICKKNPRFFGRF